MRWQSGLLRAVSFVIGTLLLAASPAAADPVFGPVTYESVQTYTEIFQASAGPYVLVIHNGDDGGAMVSSGSITINGAEVVGDTWFARELDRLRISVRLLAGDNTVSVTLNGDPGSFITLALYPLRDRPDLSFGRLLLPHASVNNLVLDLKNGSHRFGRWVRVLFYDDAGANVGSSNRIFMAPSSSSSQLASSLIANGSWTSGSVEVFYAGRGPGRVFGQSVPTDATTSVASIVPLQHAGHRRALK
jgi:hypothetical protein